MLFIFLAEKRRSVFTEPRFLFLLGFFFKGGGGWT